MKTLLLLRHAKSAWDDPGIGDFDRPLAERGRHAAPVMGRFMADSELNPDCILCSSAVRARETLALVAETAEWRQDPIFRDDLYLATPTKLLREVRRLPTGCGTALLVGHNPGMHALALDLVGMGCKADIEQLARKYPTAALAVIDFEVSSWGGVQPGEGRLRIWKTPRQLTV